MTLWSSPGQHAFIVFSDKCYDLTVALFTMVNKWEPANCQGMTQQHAGR